MKNHLIPAIKLTLICICVFVVAYSALIWGAGQLLATNNGKGEIVNYLNKNNPDQYGFSNIGQSFTADNYFQSRPSAVGYNAAGSGASNKGATNEEYLALVQARIDTFLVHNPEITKKDIPVDLITASGSGLDPHITPKSAMIQVPRISKKRNISQEKIVNLIHEYTEKPLLGMVGPTQVNVLKLNIALDQLK